MHERAERTRELSEEQVVSIWNGVTMPHGARESSVRPGTFEDGLYYIADVRTQEPRSHADLRLSSLKFDGGNYHIYVNDMSVSDIWGKRNEETYEAAVNLVATIAAKMTHNGVAIDRIGFQGAYDSSAIHEADITERYHALLEELQVAQ